MQTSFEYKGRRVEMKWRKSNHTIKLWFARADGKHLCSSYGSLEEATQKAKSIIDQKDIAK
jgi:hypothetical protein